MTTLNQVYKAPKISPGKEPKVKPANSLEHAPQAVQPTQRNMTSKPMTDNKDIYKLGSYQALQELGLEKHAYLMAGLRAIGSALSAGKSAMPAMQSLGTQVATHGRQVGQGLKATFGPGASSAMNTVNNYGGRALNMAMGVPGQVAGAAMDAHSRAGDIGKGLGL